MKEHTATEHGKTTDKINNHIDEEHRKTRKEAVQQIGENTTRAHEETRNLVSKELGRLRIEDNEEHAKTRDHVDQQIQTLQAATLSVATRDKFLKSLNFQGRDQRFNDVKEAHYRHFSGCLMTWMRQIVGTALSRTMIALPTILVIATEARN
jgi:hypothetical protein